MIVALMHLSTTGTPPGNSREPRKNGTVRAFLFPRGGGKLLLLETTSQDYGNIPTGFIRVSSRPSFFAPFYFILMSNFDILLRLFVLSPREGLFFINFMSFTDGHGLVFLVCGKNTKSNSLKEANDERIITSVNMKIIELPS